MSAPTIPTSGTLVEKDPTNMPVVENDAARSAVDDEAPPPL